MFNFQISIFPEKDGSLIVVHFRDGGVQKKTAGGIIIAIIIIVLTFYANLIQIMTKFGSSRL